MDYECHLLLTIAYSYPLKILNANLPLLQQSLTFFVSLSYLFLVIINKSQNYTDSIMNEVTSIRIKWKTIANNKETLTCMNGRAVLEFIMSAICSLVTIIYKTALAEKQTPE